MMMNLQCCVLMPFDAKYDWVYDTIRNATQFAVDGVSIVCRRADEARRSEQIDQRIVNSVRSASFVIADATGANPNVMWELGYATAFGTPTILLARNGSQLPFNIEHYDVVRYEDGARAALHESLTERVRDIVKPMDESSLLEHLASTVPLGRRRDVVEYYEQSDNLLLKYFITHHLNEYASAVASVQAEKLRLPSSEREKAAIDALRSAKRFVRAITIVDKDQWLNEPTRYFKENVACAERGRATPNFQFQRIIVHRDPNLADPGHPLNDPAKARMFQRFREARIEMREGVDTDIVAYLERTYGKEFYLKNLLIVDDTVMTRADEANHGGTLFTSRPEILRATRMFDDIWHFLSAREWPRDVQKES